MKVDLIFIKTEIETVEKFEIQLQDNSVSVRLDITKSQFEYLKNIFSVVPFPDSNKEFSAKQSFYTRKQL